MELIDRSSGKVISLDDHNRGWFFRHIVYWPFELIMLKRYVFGSIGVIFMFLVLFSRTKWDGEPIPADVHDLAHDATYFFGVMYLVLGAIFSRSMIDIKTMYYIRSGWEFRKFSNKNIKIQRYISKSSKGFSSIVSEDYQKFILLGAAIGFSRFSINWAVTFYSLYESTFSESGIEHVLSVIDKWAVILFLDVVHYFSVPIIVMALFEQVSIDRKWAKLSIVIGTGAWIANLLRIFIADGKISYDTTTIGSIVTAALYFQVFFFALASYSIIKSLTGNWTQAARQNAEGNGQKYDHDIFNEDGKNSKFSFESSENIRRVIVKCENCGNRIRLPAGKEGMVVCPHCSNSFWQSTEDVSVNQENIHNAQHPIISVIRRNRRLIVPACVLILGAAGFLSHTKSDKLPELTVTFDQSGIWRKIKVVSHDERKIVISRVIINGKYNVDECDITPEPLSEKNKQREGLEAFLPTNPLPVTLQLSDGFWVAADRTCNDPVSVEFVTNFGTERYKFD